MSGARVPHGLVLPDATTGGTGVIAAGNRCPAITDAQPFAQRITTAGTYYVRVSPVGDLADTVDYKLRFEIVRP